MLSTTSEYALRIMVTLAQSEGRPMTSEFIATTTGVPPDYAVKVLQMLARGQLVRARRGRGGGFRIACDPEKTTLLDVVNVIDPLPRLSPCPLEPDEKSSELCGLHHHLDAVIALVHERLRRVTLHDVVHDSPEPPLCPPAPRTPRVEVTAAAKSAARNAH